MSDDLMADLKSSVENYREGVGRPLPKCDTCGETLWGGSHYHCARCGGTCSMMGHYTTVHVPENWSGRFKDMTKVEGHQCCPGDCEIDKEYKR